MNKNKLYEYKYLINSLILFSASFSYLKSLDSPSFDIEFELGAEFEIGFNEKYLEKLLREKTIDVSIYNKLLDFKKYILLVPDAFWTIYELESNPIWESVREMASELLHLLGENEKKYDFSIIRTI